MAKKFKTTPLSEKINRDVFFGTSPDLPHIIEVDLVQLRPNPDQPRMKISEDSIGELANSIEQHGLIQPIAVSRDPNNPDGFIVVAGERRFRAFQLLGKQTIPAIMTTGAHDEIALIENIQRENLHPLDEARALANLMQRHGYSQGDVAKVVGKSRPTINELLRLATLPWAIQQECRTSDTPKSTLIEIAKIDTEADQLAAWEHMKRGGLTVRQARATKQSPLSAQPKHLAEQVLHTGDGFMRQLRKLSPGDVTATPELLQKFNLLQEQISDLLFHLTATQEADDANT